MFWVFICLLYCLLAKMFVPVNADRNIDWTGWTLVTPTISIGNVGQLTMDIFLNDSQAELIGYLHDDSILPMVGNHPLQCLNNGECVLTTAAQVYSDQQNKRVFVQLRSPLVRGKNVQFISRLTEWIERTKFGRVLVVTSTHSYERTDAQLTGTQLRWLCSPKFKSEIGTEFVEKVNWLVELEPRNNLERTNPNDSYPHIFLPGSGFAKNLYTKCIDADIPVGVFLIFCSEGNNSLDAIMLASHIHPVLTDADFSSIPAKHKTSEPSPKTNLTTPSSWRYMFGNTFEQAIF